MDFFHRTDSASLRGEFAKKPGETKFTIYSVYALTGNSETLNIPKPHHLSEREFKQRIDRCKNESDEFDVPDDYQQWRQRLVTADVLHPKPLDTAAALNLLYIRPGEGKKLQSMMFETLKDMIDLFGIELSFIHPLWRNTDVWQSARRRKGRASFLLVIQKLYAMACVFLSKERETTLIVFGKDATADSRSWDKDYRGTNYNFYRPGWYLDETLSQETLDSEEVTEKPTKPPMLERLQPHHLYRPFSFAYMGLIDYLFSLEIRSDAQVAFIGKLEEEEEKADTGLETLIRSSQKARDSIAEMERLFRGLEVAAMVLETMEREHKSKEWYIAPATADTKNRYQEATTWLAEALPACRQRLKAQKIQVQSQDKRAKGLTQMNIALISARETRSMRALTIMATAFLPATSIAALFAVPWDRGNGRSRINQGIVFGVVTLVAYTVVFITWWWLERSPASDAKKQPKWLSWMERDPASDAKKQPKWPSWMKRGPASDTKQQWLSLIRRKPASEAKQQRRSGEA